MFGRPKSRHDAVRSIISKHTAIKQQTRKLTGVYFFDTEFRHTPSTTYPWHEIDEKNRPHSMRHCVL